MICIFSIENATVGRLPVSIFLTTFSLLGYVTLILFNLQGGACM